MHTLYYSPQSCSLAPHIVLEEIGAPYAAELVTATGGAREAEPADVALAALLLARAAATIARMIEAVGGLVGVTACHGEARS